MKQVIVLVAMIVLGVAIAGMVTQFKTSATTITKSANDQIVNKVIPTSQSIDFEMYDAELEIVTA